MKIIGLTGGIASGKSTVARTLKDLGAILIDSDELAHAVIKPNQPAWNDIIKALGEQNLNPDMSINRAQLGEIVFNDPVKLEQLNQIVHPRVMERHQQCLEQIKSIHPDAIVVMDVPLLFETHMEQMCNETWVVWVDRETQIDRLMSRNNYNREEAVARINAQMSLDEKAQRADVIIDNSKSIEKTIETTTRYFNEII